MAAPATGPAEVRIGSMTVRGRGLSPGSGRSLAAAVAAALADRLPGGRIGGMTIRMPASVLDAGGGIDRAVLARAIAHARRDLDA